MKPAIIAGMLMLTTFIATWLYARKLRDHPPASETFAAGLAGIDASLKTDQSLLLYTPGVPGEGFLYVRLALAPRHVALYDSRQPADTVLYIFGAQAQDTLMNGRKVVWERQSGGYHYQLLSIR